MYVLLVYVYAKPECTPPMKHAKCVGKTCVLVQTKCTSAVHANQGCTYAVHANHDTHASRLTSRVYTRGLNMHFTSDSLIFHAHLGYIVSIFRNNSSRVFASHVCSQV